MIESICENCGYSKYQLDNSKLECLLPMPPWTYQDKYRYVLPNETCCFHRKKDKK